MLKAVSRKFLKVAVPVQGRSAAVDTCLIRRGSGAQMGVLNAALKKILKFCCCSSGVEHFLGKEEVRGSNPLNSSERVFTL